jgi:alpha-tubulin suppressor-like RCC1 family protein
MAAACADDGTVFVVENGAVYACGRGQYGQLGLNSREHQRLPARVGGEEVHGGSPVLMVAACGLHRAALTVDGAIWTCGHGSYGQLGHGDAQDRLLPTRLGPEAFGGLPVVLVACGWVHTMALTGGGCVWTCGGNDSGQLGHGDRTGKHLFTRVDPGHFGGSIVMAVCGYEHSVVASAAGDVFTWGRGSYGRLGHNDEQDRLAPARLGREQFAGGMIVFVAAGGAHTFSLSEGGVMWVWGFGVYGQLGLGDRDNRLVPTRLGAGEVFGGSPAIALWSPSAWLAVRMAACGGWHTLVATEQGGMWAFGRGAHGQLGSNDKNDRLVPTRVVARRAADLFLHFATVAAGSEHSAAVTEGGALFTWGRGEAVLDDAGSQVPGGLGHTSRDDRLVPTLVSPSLLGVSVYTSTDVKEFKVGKAGGSGFVRVRVCLSTSLPFSSTVSSTASIFAMA